MFNHKRNLALLAGALCVAGCQGSSGNEVGASNNEGAPAAARQADRTVAEMLSGSVDHVTFAQALESAGLIDTFRGIGAYTVFAPTNAAFEAMPEDARRRFTAPDQRQRLISRLSYHVVPGTVTVEDISRAIARAPGGRAELATVTGGTLTLSREGDAIVVSDGRNGEARITRPDQILSNGVVHSIDAVLTPEG